MRRCHCLFFLLFLLVGYSAFSMANPLFRERLEREWQSMLSETGVSNAEFENVFEKSWRGKISIDEYKKYALLDERMKLLLVSRLAFSNRRFLSREVVVDPELRLGACDALVTNNTLTGDKIPLIEFIFERDMDNFNMVISVCVDNENNELYRKWHDALPEVERFSAFDKRFYLSLSKALGHSR